MIFCLLNLPRKFLCAKVAVCEIAAYTKHLCVNIYFCVKVPVVKGTCVSNVNVLVCRSSVCKRFCASQVLCVIVFRVKKILRVLRVIFLMCKNACV